MCMENVDTVSSAGSTQQRGEGRRRMPRTLSAMSLKPTSALLWQSQCLELQPSALASSCSAPSVVKLLAMSNLGKVSEIPTNQVVLDHRSKVLSVNHVVAKVLKNLKKEQ